MAPHCRAHSHAEWLRSRRVTTVHSDVDLLPVLTNLRVAGGSRQEKLPASVRRQDALARRAICCARLSLSRLCGSRRGSAEPQSHFIRLAGPRQKPTRAINGRTADIRILARRIGVMCVRIAVSGLRSPAGIFGGGSLVCYGPRVVAVGVVGGVGGFVVLAAVAVFVRVHGFGDGLVSEPDLDDPRQVIIW